MARGGAEAEVEAGAAVAPAPAEAQAAVHGGADAGAQAPHGALRGAATADGDDFEGGVQGRKRRLSEGDVAPAAGERGVDALEGVGGDAHAPKRRKRALSMPDAAAARRAKLVGVRVRFDEATTFEATWSCDLLNDNPDREEGRRVMGVCVGEADTVDREPEEFDLRHCDRCCVSLLADFYTCQVCERTDDGPCHDLCPACFNLLQANSKGSRRKRKTWHAHGPEHFKRTIGDRCDICFEYFFVRAPHDGSGMVPPYVPNERCKCGAGEGVTTVAQPAQQPVQAIGTGSAFAPVSATGSASGAGLGARTGGGAGVLGNPDWEARFPAAAAAAALASAAAPQPQPQPQQRQNQLRQQQLTIPSELPPLPSPADLGVLGDAGALTADTSIPAVGEPQYEEGQPQCPQQ